jgi:uncharacterized protein YjiK
MDARLPATALTADRVVLVSPSTVPALRPSLALAPTLLLALSLLAAAAAVHAAEPDVEEWPLRELPEPSGVAYDAARKTLFVAGDEGDLAEVSTDGRLLRLRHLGGDLEGITYDPDNGLLYLVREGKDVVLEVRPSDLTVVREIAIDRAFAGDPNFVRSGGDGIEGITYKPGARGGAAGTFYAVNQFDPPVLLELGASLASSKATVVSIDKAWSMENAPLSDVAWDPVADAFVIVSALWRAAYVVSAQGKRLATVHLPGIMQEGLARLPDGSFVIVQDTGGLLRWRPASEPFRPSDRAADPNHAPNLETPAN